MEKQVTRTPGQWKSCINTLTKKPCDILIILRDEDMENEDNVFLPADSENRKDLIKFMDNLPYAFLTHRGKKTNYTYTTTYKYKQFLIKVIQADNLIDQFQLILKSNQLEQPTEYTGLIEKVDEIIGRLQLQVNQLQEMRDKQHLKGLDKQIELSRQQLNQLQDIRIQILRYYVISKNWNPFYDENATYETKSIEHE
jgi:hypothetical protein